MQFDESELLITKTSYTCRCCRQARLKRSRTVHWASRTSCRPSVDVRGAVEALTSGEWEKQHDALRFLSCFFEANSHKEDHELRSWSLEQVQQLCSGLVFVASSLRSQVGTQSQMPFVASFTINRGFHIGNLLFTLKKSQFTGAK